MKKKFYKGAMTASVLAVCMFLLVGCGSNLFEDFVDQPEDTDPIELIKQASTPDDYDKVEQLALTVISSESASSEQKQDALIANAEAIFGQNEISSLEIGAKFADAASNGSSNGENMITEISETVGLTDENGDVIEEKKTDILIAALSTNAASALSTELLGTSFKAQAAGDLDANEALIGMMANALASFVIINDVITLEEDGTIDEAQVQADYGGDYVQVLTLLIEPTLSAAVTDFLNLIDPELKAKIESSTFPLGVAYFGDECINFITSDQVKLFTDDQVDIIRRIQEYTGDFYQLYKAVTTEGTYTNGSTSVTFSSGDSVDTTSDKVKTIIEDIFKDFKL